MILSSGLPVTGLFRSMIMMFDIVFRCMYKCPHVYAVYFLFRYICIYLYYLYMYKLWFLEQLLMHLQSCF